MPLFLGCIADDFTGATDVASAFTAKGLRVTLLLEVPDGRMSVKHVDAVVVALPIRSVKPMIAVRHALAAYRWLQRQGARRIYFK